MGGDIMGLQSAVNAIKKQINKLGNDVVLKKEIKTECPGAMNMGSFDKLQDSKYHTDNPGAPICSMGHVVIYDTLQVKAIIEHITVVSDKILKLFGNIEVGDLIASVDPGINIPEYNFLEFNSKHYKIEGKQEDIYGNMTVRWLVHLKRGDAYGK